MIDLHTHTIASDGTYSPEELIKYAIQKNLTAISITDHDTIDGLKPAINYMKANNITPDQLQLINGIELSTNIPKYNFDIHIIGLFINPDDPTFINRLSSVIDDRTRRNTKMLSLIQRAGYDLSLKDVTDYSKDSVVTRSHFAKVLVMKGYFNDTNEVFAKLIGNGKPAYVPREDVHAKFGIELIKNSGGIPIIAHPTLYGLDSNGLYGLIDELKGYGLAGIESYYSLYTKQQTKAMKHIASRFKLLEVGGSDFHGANKIGNDLAVGHGNLNVPDELLVHLQDYLNSNKK
jgi:hypothetical protein